MQTSVVFTAQSKVGNMPRISLAVRRLGYHLINVTMARKSERSIDLITVVVDTELPLESQHFSSIVAEMPSVIRADVMAKTSGTTTRSSAEAQTQVRESDATPVNQARNTLRTDADKAAFVKREGRKLVAAYPAIRDALAALEGALHPSVRSEMMTKMGRAVGQWQYRKNYAQREQKKAPTRRAFGLRQSQFNRLSELNSLVKGKSVKKKRGTTTSADPLDQIKKALSDFLTVTMDGRTIYVSDCPHCAAQRETTVLDCDFVRAFVDGFMVEIDALKDVKTSQQQSQALGNQLCVFEIS